VTERKSPLCRAGTALRCSRTTRAFGRKRQLIAVLGFAFHYVLRYGNHKGRRDDDCARTSKTLRRAERMRNSDWTFRSREMIERIARSFLHAHVRYTLDSRLARLVARRILSMCPSAVIRVQATRDEYHEIESSLRIQSRITNEIDENRTSLKSPHRSHVDRSIQRSNYRGDSRD